MLNELQYHLSERWNRKWTNSATRICLYLCTTLSHMIILTLVLISLLTYWFNYRSNDQTALCQLPLHTTLKVRTYLYITPRLNEHKPTKHTPLDSKQKTWGDLLYNYSPVSFGCTRERTAFVSTGTDTDLLTWAIDTYRSRWSDDDISA